MKCIAVSINASRHLMNAIRYGADLAAALGKTAQLIDGDIAAQCRKIKPFLLVTSEAPARRLSCPALVIPENVSFHSIRKIAIACDRDDILSGMAEYLPFLSELNTLLGCRFELIHVITEDEGSVSRLITEYSAWKSRPAWLPAYLHFDRQDDLQKGVSEYLNSNPADWLMVLPKSYSWIEFHDSQAKNISQLSKLPVLSVSE